MSHLTDSFNHVNENHLPSSIAFFTARRPSRRASLICVKVCLFGPLRSSVTDRGLLHSSTKVNFSSPCIKKVKFYATQDPNPNTIFPFSFSSKEAKFNTPPEICLTIYHSLPCCLDLEQSLNLQCHSAFKACILYFQWQEHNLKLQMP